MEIDIVFIDYDLVQPPSRWCVWREKYNGLLHVNWRLQQYHLILKRWQNNQILCVAHGFPVLYGSLRGSDSFLRNVLFSAPTVCKFTIFLWNTGSCCRSIILRIRYCPFWFTLGSSSTKRLFFFLRLIRFSLDRVQTTKLFLIMNHQV